MATAITTNDYIKGHDKNTKDIDTLTKRISDIVANNGNGTKDVEIVDARRGKASLRDRIDEVENKIALNNDEISKETKDARVDFDGGIHKNLNLRLLEDFNSLYKLIYNSTLLEYEGQYITANNSYKSITEDLQIKGQTLQNLLKLTRNDILVQYGSVATWQLYKPGTVYTIKITNKSAETKKYFLNEYCFTAGSEITLLTNQTLIVKTTTLTNFTQPESTLEILLKNKITHTQPNNFEILVLEGDWTNKEIPYFEGIRSVSESGETLEVISCGKNLINTDTLIKGWINTTTGEFETNNSRYVSDFIRVGNKSIVMSRSNANTISTIWAYKYDINKKYMESVPLLNPSNTTKAINFNCRYIKLGIPHPTKEEINTLELQLEEGTVGTPYEQYKENRQVVPLAEPLRGLLNGACDVVDFEKGKIIKNIGKVTFKGDENIVLATTKVNTIVFAIDVAPVLVYTDIYNIMCDKFSTGINIVDVNVDAEGTRIVSNASRVYISILKSKLTTSDVTGFKAWLKANPTTVYYQLATPVETSIDIIPPRTYEEVTNIFTTGSLIESTLKCKVSSNIPAKIQSLSLENKTLQAENINLRSTVEDNNLASIETDIRQEAKITMLKLGVI